MSGLLLEPLKYYRSEAEMLLRENLLEHFDSLVKTAGVNEDENRETVRLYHTENLAIKLQKKKIRKQKILRVLTVIMAVLLAPILGLGIFLGIFLIKKKINPKIRLLNDELAKMIERSTSLYNTAECQMSSLNNLFRSEDTFRIIEKTVPEINFDNRFTVERVTKMMQYFDYANKDAANSSVHDALSGELNGNPFIFEREYRMDITDASYTGTLPISWTEYYSDTKGNRRRRRRTQILHASVTKPRPVYNFETHLSFGSQAAPDLAFSRKHAHTEDMSENERERKVKRGHKKLRRKAERAVAKEQNFQVMTNDEFDVLFGASDRTHELQFRLLFTPLAQNNIMDLISCEVGYGDDFDFYKRGRYNRIRSDHSQSWRMKPSADDYKSYDIDISRKAFISINKEYFKSVYFDFAPILAIPAYQEQPTGSMEMPDTYSSLYPQEEHEALANAIGEAYFRHPDSATPSVLKASTVKTSESFDRVNITARGNITVLRVDYIPTFGGDGRMHSVPVTWTEYIPIEKHTHIAVFAVDKDRHDFLENNKHTQFPDHSAYFHGLMAFPVASNASDADIQNIINKIVK